MNIVDKIKGYRVPSEIWAILIIIMATTASFGLGRLSVGREEDEGVLYLPTPRYQVAAIVGIDAKPVDFSSNPAPASGQGTLVASKNGTRYYLPWCSGAKQIKEENKVWFESQEQAEKAGYTPALNCKGI